MDVKTESLQETFDKLKSDLIKNNSKKEIDAIYEFIKQNRANLYNNKILPVNLTKNLINFLSNNGKFLDIIMDIYKIYIEEFFNTKNFPEDEIDNFKDILITIFTIESNIYTEVVDYTGFLRQYFAKYYPKKSNIIHEEGDVVEVLIADIKANKSILGWTHFTIKRVDKERKLYIFDSLIKGISEINLSFNDYKIQEKNTFANEEEVNWKKNLKLNDLVDVYNYKKNLWVEGYVKKINEEGEYYIQPVGEPDDTLDFGPFTKHSPFIQPLLKFSFKYDPEDKACFKVVKGNNEHNPYNYYLPVTENNYTIPWENVKKYSMMYFDIANFFIIKLISSNVLMDESISIMYIYIIFHQINYLKGILNMNFLYKYIFENCFTHLQNVFYKYSLSKQKSVNINSGWKNIISHSLYYLTNNLSYINYIFNYFISVPQFYITFGYNCFKNSDNLEKRHIGLTQIKSICVYLKTYYPLKGIKSINKSIEFLHNTLFNIDNKDDIFTLLYSEFNIHEELLSKGNEIITFISELKILNDKHIEYLYKLATATPENSDANKFIYSLLNNIITNLFLKQNEIIFYEIIKLPYDKLRKCDIELAKNILENAPKESFLPMAKSFLNYYYLFITEYKNFDVEYNEDFGKFISFAKDQDTLMILYPTYFKKVLEEIYHQKNLEKYRYYFTLLHSIFDSLYYLDKQKFNINLIKEELKKIFYEKYNNNSIIVDKLLELYNLDNNEKKEDYFMDVVDIVDGFINFIEDKAYFTIDSLIKLSELFIFSAKSKKNRKHFIYNIIFIKKEESDLDKLYEFLFEKIDKYLDIITPDKLDDFLDDDFVNAILSLYQRINNKSPDIKNKTDIEKFIIEKNKYLEKINPLKTKYFDIIWKMFYKTKNTDKITYFLKDFSLKNFSEAERFEIWEKLCQKLFADLESNLLVGLTMLNSFIKISEKYGNAQVNSHISDLYYHEYQKNIQLKFSTNTKYFINVKSSIEKEHKYFEFFVSSTIWDIKYTLEKILGYDPIIQQIFLPGNKKVLDDSLPLYKAFPKIINKYENEINVDLERSHIVSNTPAYPLLSEDKTELTDKFVEIICNIFYKYAENDQLSYLNFATFIKDIYAPLDKTKYEMEQIFVEKFNSFSNKKNYLTLDDFLLYFSNVAQNEIDFAYHILLSLGYTKSLDYYLDKIEKDNILYYEKNNTKEFMPRYFIGNNLDYIKRIFKLLKTDNEQIYNLAKDIIYELSTPEIFKDILFQNKDKSKLNEILYDDNLELKVYIYDIIITIINDELNYDRNLVNNFIENNLDKLINEFDKIYINQNKNENIINTNDKKESSTLFNKKKYIRYYSSIIKLLLLCFKNIINQKDLNDYIENFVENKDIDINKLKINLDEEKQILIKKINLPNLLITILNNIIDLNDDKDEIKSINSAKLIIYITLLISNYYNEDDKQKIYKNFFEKEVNILFNCTNYDIEYNIFKMVKILFPLMTGEKDKIFVELQNDGLIKYLKDYKKLNSVKDDILNFFDLFLEIINVFKTTKNDEIFDLFQHILNIITDDKIIIKKILIEGYLYIINDILKILKENKYEKIYKYNFDKLISILINRHLITFEKNENILTNELNYFIDFSIISTIYQILTKIIQINPEKYILLFFENEKIKNLRQKHLSKLEDDKTNYSPSGEIKDIYVGLYNPSALCYINSVIQQFFMIPLFQNTILSLPMQQNLKPDLDNDDFLFQLQKMFYNLKYSYKNYYNPKSFVLSFKDSKGKSPDLNEQCDAQEFLLRLLEKINDTLKNTKNKYLCDNIFGGNTLQQVRCTNPECCNISERRDDINYLSLEIKNKNKLSDCLKGFIAEEKIEDYHCEKCDKKITHIKQVLIDQIPNILIIHLQRFVFNYTFFTMEKLNTPVMFSETLNIKEYTVDKNNNDIPLDYFDYELQGTLIHSGQQQYGHYYSLIYNNKKKSFYEFNDMNIKAISFDEGMQLSFGNKPIIVNSKTMDENLQKKIDEKNDLDMIEYNDKKYYLYENDKDAIKKNINFDNDIKNIIIIKDKIEAELMKYDDALNLLINENSNHYETKPFIDKIIEENIKIKNDDNFYSDRFNTFINSITEVIKNEIINDKTKQKIIIYIPILKSLNDYIINIIAISKEKKELSFIINNIINIYEYFPNDEFISYLIEYIDEIKENIFKNYLVSKDRIKGKQIGKYISKIISISIDNNINIDLANNIIQYYIDKIPVEISKKWLDMECFNEFICYLIENSDSIKRYLIKINIISKLIDFILGHSSPLYKHDERNEFKNTKGYFEPIIKGIALLYKYYENNISDEDLILSPDDITLINHNNFYEEIIHDYSETKAANLLLENKICLILSLSIKENKVINDEEILDLLINKKTEKIKTREDLISYLELLINIIKKYCSIYLDKNNDILLEKLNILLGLPIPTVTSGDAEIKYISGKFYNKYTILTNISKEENMNEDMVTLLNLLYDLLNINDIVFNYLDKLPAPNSLKYTYVDYLLNLYLSNKEELEKIDNDNKLLYKYNDIIKRHNKENINKFSIKDRLYFSDFSYELKNNENIKLYELKIKYSSLKEPKKTTLDCFNNITFFNDLNNNIIKNEEKKEDKEEEEKEGDKEEKKEDKEGNKEEKKEVKEKQKEEDEINLNNFFCILVFCHDNLDVSIEFKPYFNSRLEIKGKKNNHYIFYCTNDEKPIDYTNIKIETKINTDNEFIGHQNDGKDLTFKFGGSSIILGSGAQFKTFCQVCGVQNIITNKSKNFNCSFCECPLINN